MLKKMCIGLHVKCP